jgi:hypothetical protein
VVTREVVVGVPAVVVLVTVLVVVCVVVSVEVVVKLTVVGRPGVVRTKHWEAEWALTAPPEAVVLTSGPEALADPTTVTVVAITHSATRDGKDFRRTMKK